MKKAKDNNITYGAGIGMPMHHDMPANTPAAGTDEAQGTCIPDFTNIDEVRRAFIASEIFNRKY